MYKPPKSLKKFGKKSNKKSKKNIKNNNKLAKTPRNTF